MLHEHTKLMNSLLEYNTVQEAARHMAAITGGNTHFRPVDTAQQDATLQFVIGQDKYLFFVEVKKELREMHIPAILEKIGHDKEQWLLVCRYIPKQVKERLKSLGVNNLDAAGNCYIRAGRLFLYINDKPVTPVRENNTGKLWARAGLKLVLAILTEPGIVGTPYRNIAQKAGIALGNVGGLLAELKNGGHLANKTKLATRWAEQYNTRVKPKLLKTQLQWPLDKQTNWESMQGPFYWGGEAAGSLYTTYLNPQHFTIYTQAPDVDIIKALGAIPAPDGNLALYTAFWAEALQWYQHTNHSAVPPLVAYADLLETGDSRNLEIAERIKDTYLN